MKAAAARSSARLSARLRAPAPAPWRRPRQDRHKVDGRPRSHEPETTNTKDAHGACRTPRNATHRWVDGPASLTRPDPSVHTLDSHGDAVGVLPATAQPGPSGAAGAISGRLAVAGHLLSPFAHWGYDVSDYLGYRSVVRQSRRPRRARCPSRASCAPIGILHGPRRRPHQRYHAWFVSRGCSGAVRRCTVTTTSCAIQKPMARLPNNWVSIFGGPAWHFDEASRPKYYRAHS